MPPDGQTKWLDVCPQAGFRSTCKPVGAVQFERRWKEGRAEQPTTLRDLRGEVSKSRVSSEETFGRGDRGLHRGP